MWRKFPVEIHFLLVLATPKNYQSIISHFNSCTSGINLMENESVSLLSDNLQVNVPSLMEPYLKKEIYPNWSWTNSHWNSNWLLHYNVSLLKFLIRWFTDVSSDARLYPSASFVFLLQYAMTISRSYCFLL